MATVTLLKTFGVEVEAMAKGKAKAEAKVKAKEKKASKAKLKEKEKASVKEKISLTSLASPQKIKLVSRVNHQQLMKTFHQHTRLHPNVSSAHLDSMMKKHCPTRKRTEASAYQNQKPTRKLLGS